MRLIHVVLPGTSNCVCVCGRREQCSSFWVKFDQFNECTDWHCVVVRNTSTCWLYWCAIHRHHHHNISNRKKWNERFFDGIGNWYFRTRFRANSSIRHTLSFSLNCNKCAPKHANAYFLDGKTRHRWMMMMIDWLPSWHIRKFTEK